MPNRFALQNKRTKPEAGRDMKKAKKVGEKVRTVGIKKKQPKVTGKVQG